MERVTLENTSVHRIRSEEIGQDYLISVGLPPGYDKSTTPYPVVYVTDGGARFVSLHAAVPMLQIVNELPAFISVGIDYDVKHTAHSITLRNRDLTHCDGDSGVGDDAPDWYKKLPQVKPGGAEAFLRFINRQVKPLVREKFNASDDSTYTGYSFGGLFGLYTLFTSPDSFCRYVLGSPSIWWAGKDILSLEKNYADSHEDLEAIVYMSSGRLEETPDQADQFGMVSNMINLAETLENRNYPGLSLTHQVIEEETHMSGGANGDASWHTESVCRLSWMDTNAVSGSSALRHSVRRTR